MKETKELSVQLIQVSGSPYCQTVRIALAEKGVPFSVIDEDLRNKSKLLLEANPVHKKIPVLIHNGRPIVETGIIVQYIDETWPGDDSHSFFPDTVYKKAQARFWSHFIHEKVIGPAFLVLKARDSEVDQKALMESMVTLNSAIIQSAGDEKPFFFGKGIGYVDMAIAPYISWLPFLAKHVNLQLPTRTAAPRLHEWLDALAQHPNVQPVLFDPAMMEKKLESIRASNRLPVAAGKLHS